MDFTDCHLFDLAAYGELDWFEFWEEFQQFPNILLTAELISKIRSLHQQLTLFGNDSCVHITGAYLRNFMEYKIIFQMSWAILMNLGEVE